jgi:hypothetical protein
VDYATDIGFGVGVAKYLIPCPPHLLEDILHYILRLDTIATYAQSKAIEGVSML